ncbi:hypothetical protein [Hymenobacter metallilatus]|uniref:Uncharacterized protein n=1 Tax=Hymenobacter metallilatus TaxID=2493666 RepID=A0A428JQY3_9BACT|nr:hypothetical protein [Hymenobacter metallilatus]RSK36020.1 hypothetical protein EI290_03760 [Hymenobacter metallilatus]
MFRAPFCWILLVLLLAARPSRAQTKPAPPPPQKVLTVRVTLPTVLGKLGEVTGLLPNPRKAKAQTSTDNPVVTLAVPLPRFLSGATNPPPEPTKP